MAHLRECLVRGGRAYLDAADVAAVIVSGDDFASLARPDAPIRLLLSGCGDAVDIFGTSVSDLFGEDEKRDWLPASKFIRMRMKGGHAFIAARHVVGLLMTGDGDNAPTSEKAPLSVLFRGAKSPLRVWGQSALDFLFWMREAGRKIDVLYPHRPPDDIAPAPVPAPSGPRHPAMGALAGAGT